MSDTNIIVTTVFLCVRCCFAVVLHACRTMQYRSAHFKLDSSLVWLGNVAPLHRFNFILFFFQSSIHIQYNIWYMMHACRWQYSNKQNRQFVVYQAIRWRDEHHYMCSDIYMGRERERALYSINIYVLCTAIM